MTVTGVNLNLLFSAVPTVTDNFTPYQAPTGEVQTVEILGGTDAGGGALNVAGANVILDGNLSIDETGAAIVSNFAAIQAANPLLAGVAYDTATNLLTFTYSLAAGDVPPVTIGEQS